MKRIIITAGAGLLVAIPAIAGLAGNTSFAQSLPVHVPSYVIVVDDHGGQRAKSIAKPGDDHGGQRAKGIAEPGDNHGGQRAKGIAVRGDNHGGQRAGAVAGPGAGAVAGPGAGAVAGPVQDGGAGHGELSHRSGGHDSGPTHR
jgi:hypothetical protein